MFEALSVEWLRHIILVARKGVFAREKPRDMDIRASASLCRVKEALGESHFTNAKERSYYYKGEDLNLLRPEYEDDKWRWYQMHVRVWKEDGCVEISAHYELDATVYPREHLNEVNYSKEPAVSTVYTILQEYGLDVEKIE